ncbi:Uncharacterized protein dnl_29400 [Desulfonema limicola]|uniref:Uncharacterized protein n=1 Tax=Desulfonema limicola TaxID=45656 RepID=A0A975B7Z8_9BACT|nr:Uncharacterized protein dnl_29400 [Desulfonema limicola]
MKLCTSDLCPFISRLGSGKSSSYGSSSDKMPLSIRQYFC